VPVQTTTFAIDALARYVEDLRIALPEELPYPFVGDTTGARACRLGRAQIVDA